MPAPVLRFSADDAPFCRDAAASFTLPARFYYDSEVYAREKAAIFYRNWIYAGHRSQLAQPGEFITKTIHEQNVFVIRDKSGGLKAYYNVCQHRGHELVFGAGRKKSYIV